MWVAIWGVVHVKNTTKKGEIWSSAMSKNWWIFLVDLEVTNKTVFCEKEIWVCCLNLYAMFAGFAVMVVIDGEVLANVVMVQIVKKNCDFFSFLLWLLVVGLTKMELTWWWLFRCNTIFCDNSDDWWRTSCCDSDGSSRKKKTRF